MPKTKTNSKAKRSAKKSKVSSRRPFFGVSRKAAIIFILLFACVGTYFYVKSYAYRTVGISNGSIYAFCGFSHRSNDDPIVFPNRPGAAHSHDFFGAKGLNAFSTNDSIRQQPTSCHRPQDKSAYWIPTMYYNDQAVSPTCTDLYNPACFRITAVYGNDHQILKYMQPFPAGLRVIAGTSSGGSAFPPNRNEPIWIWLCRNSTVVAPGNATTAPTCSESSDPANFPQYLQLRIQFPSCWDGKNLDSPNHKSHMAYAYQQGGNIPANRCPPTHPVQVPDLTIDIGYYGVKGGPAARLSSGDMSTVHADFMNGWDQSFFANLMNICLKRDVYCGGGSVPVANHNNEADDVDDAAVQRYLNSPEYRQYVIQAEKAYPQTSSSAAAPSTGPAAKPRTSSTSSSGNTGSGDSSQTSQSGDSAGKAEPHSLQAGMHSHTAAKVYTVAVKVLDQNGKPAKGIKVKLNNKVSYSDYRGIAGFTDISPGQIKLVAEGRGSKVSRQVYIVDTGKPTEHQVFVMNIRDMRRATYAAIGIGALTTGLLLYRLGAYSWVGARFGR
jgi:hypothetical protein